MKFRALRVELSASLIAVSALAWSSTGALADQPAQPFDDDSIEVSTANLGGADPLSTDRTVQHWSDQTENPLNHVTYRYNMVGVDPRTNGSATIGVDIIPINVVVNGVTFSGQDSVEGVLNSPLFNEFDYSNVIFSTKRDPVIDPKTGAVIGYICCVRRLPAIDALGNVVPFEVSGDQPGQLIDATMRSQFNKVGSDYHLLLDTPQVHEPVTVDVPSHKGIVITSPVGVQAADLDISWFQTRIQNLTRKLHLDPTRLAIFLTTDVVLFKEHNPLRCCVMGGHGAGHATGGMNGPFNGNGNQPVQTFVWSSWLTPGLFGPRAWVNKDISGLSHEVSEWAADPFGNNTVQPWISANAPQYGCVAELEVGDPTVNTGFTAGRPRTLQFPGDNHFDLNPFPTQRNPFSDGMFHVQDEAFIPWFMRMPPNNTFSQVTQSGSGGRYTFMGDLNPVPELHAPAHSC